MARGTGTAVGASSCSLALAALLLGTTATPALAAPDKHHAAKHHAAKHHAAKHHAAKHHRAKPHAAKPHAATPRNPHAALPAVPAAKDEQTSPVRRGSLVLGGQLPLTVTTAELPPGVTAPELAAPEVVVPSVVVRQPPGQLRHVAAEALLDVTAVTPAAAHRTVVLRHSATGAGGTVVVGSHRHAVAAESPLVTRTLPRIGSWPSGASGFAPAASDAPLSLALGGLLLALAAARGVARVRHARPEDPDLTFGTS